MEVQCDILVQLVNGIVMIVSQGKYEKYAMSRKYVKKV